MTPAVRITKRLVDVVASAAGLLVTAPLFPIIGAAIYLDSPGPILFRQRRAGPLVDTNGRTFQTREFDMVKFRTMRPDAEKYTGPVVAGENDPRVTRVGRFLRKTRLDELPQLWNVLTGSMSLVGPRPERPELLRNLALAIPLFEERMRGVKPGITGLAQVSLGYTGKPIEGSEVLQHAAALTNPFGLEEADGAEADEFRMKLLYDMAYLASLEKFSTYLRMEASIIARTPLVMLGARGR
ncbi:MAG: glycosyl transferase [Deltaproteobacteria bacterium]|nr:MAG: glycosyl transferase [Deltaproteobacteria bacterium]